MHNMSSKSTLHVISPSTIATDITIRSLSIPFWLNEGDTLAGLGENSAFRRPPFGRRSRREGGGPAPGERPESGRSVFCDYPRLLLRL